MHKCMFYSKLLHVHVLPLHLFFFHLWIQILCFFFIKKDHPHIWWKLKYIFVKCGLKIIKIKEWKKLNFYLWSLQYDFKCSINSINDDDQWNLNINIIKITDKLFTVEWYSTTLSLYPKKNAKSNKHLNSSLWLCCCTFQPINLRQCRH